MHNLNAKTKRSCSEEGTPKAKRGRPKVSPMLTRYPPLRDLGGDEVAAERNMQQLQQELERDSPRKEIVLSLARQTYSSRRTTILSEDEGASVRGFIQQFKELKKPYVVRSCCCVW